MNNFYPIDNINIYTVIVYTRICAHIGKFGDELLLKKPESAVPIGLRA
nr:MAG TPA: hypothetical protein [Caudoviricetes sp.]